MIRFISGIVVGIWLAQTYDLPNVANEFEKFQKEYLKKKK